MHSMIQTLKVELAERSYPIHIGSGLLAKPELFFPHIGQMTMVDTPLRLHVTACLK